MWTWTNRDFQVPSPLQQKPALLLRSAIGHVFCGGGDEGSSFLGSGSLAGPRIGVQE